MNADVQAGFCGVKYNMLMTLGISTDFPGFNF